MYKDKRNVSVLCNVCVYVILFCVFIFIITIRPRENIYRNVCKKGLEKVDILPDELCINEYK